MKIVNVYGTWIIISLFAFFAGYEGRSIVNIFTSDLQPKEYGYSITDTRLKTKADTVAMLRLETAIAAVERKNDGRFEVLTWSAALLITLLVIFISFNFIVSQSKVKELVEEAIDKKTADISQSMNAKYAEVEKYTEEIADKVVETEEYYNQIKTFYETLKNRE